MSNRAMANALRQSIQASGEVLRLATTDLKQESKDLLAAVIAKGGSLDFAWVGIFTDEPGVRLTLRHADGREQELVRLEIPR